jgi:hypothetical protein
MLPSELSGALGDEREWPADAARDEVGEPGDQQHDDAGDEAVIARRRVIDRIDIVDIDAGADRPFPGVEAQAVRDLLHRIFRAGMRPAVENEVAALLARLRLEADHRHAIDVGGIGAVLAFEIAVDLHQGGAVITLHEEVIVFGVTEMAKLILRRLLRLLTRELPRLLLGVPGRDDAVCDLHETLDLLHAVVDETLPQGAEPQRQGDAERD